MTQSMQLMQTILKAIEAKKGHEPVALDLQGLSTIADYFVICHGNSDIQVQSITNEVKEQAVKAGGRIRGIEGFDTGRWVLIDFGDVIVHIFHREERQFYNIERLWSDARTVEIV